MIRFGDGLVGLSVGFLLCGVFCKLYLLTSFLIFRIFLSLLGVVSLMFTSMRGDVS